MNLSVSHELVRDILQRPVHLRHPAWRSMAGIYYAQRPRIADYAFSGDRPLLRAIHYYRARFGLADNPAPRMYLYAAVHEAALWHARTHAHGGIRWQVEAMIVGRGTNQQIAEELRPAHGESTVQAYRELFFDVSSYLDRPGLVIDNILCTSQSTATGLHDVDLMWKMFAFHFGFAAAVQIQRNRAGAPMEPEHMRWFMEMTRDRVLQLGTQSVASLNGLLRNESLQLISSLAGKNAAPELETSPSSQAARNEFEHLQQIFITWNKHPRAKTMLEASTQSNEEPAPPIPLYEPPLLSHPQQEVGAA